MVARSCGSVIVSIVISAGLCEISSVMGPTGTVWWAESLRSASIFQVPEKSGLVWAKAKTGIASARRKSAEVERFRLLFDWLKTFAIEAIIGPPGAKEYRN